MDQWISAAAAPETLFLSSLSLFLLLCHALPSLRPSIPSIQPISCAWGTLVSSEPCQFAVCCPRDHPNPGSAGVTGNRTKQHTSSISYQGYLCTKR